MKKYFFPLMLAASCVCFAALAGCEAVEPEEAAEFDFGVEGGEYIFVASADGWYKVELWGGDGQDITLQCPDETVITGEGGKGGYTSIEVFLPQDTAVNVKVAGFTGATAANVYSAYGGGASTLSIDLNGDATYSADERIAVAAGGGGASETLHVGYGSTAQYSTTFTTSGAYYGNTAVSGKNNYGVLKGGTVGDVNSSDLAVKCGLTGSPGNYLDASSAAPKASTQTAVGAAGTPGGIAGTLNGVGGTFSNRVSESVGSGGAGWTGGSSGGHQGANGSGASGTNFALGHPQAVAKSALTESLAGLGISVRNPVCKAGNDTTIPVKTAYNAETGEQERIDTELNGVGYAKITPL